MDIKDRKNLEGNINKVYLMNLFDGLQFSLPIVAIFLLDNNKMSFAQMGLIVGASSLVSFILDIPFSIWADKHSRKSFLVLSNTAFMLLNVIFFLSHSFGMFFLGYCFNGLGTAFCSGIAGAFVYDSLLSLGREKQYEKIQSKIIKCRFAGKIIATATGAYIYYAIDPRMPFLLQALASLVCIVLSLQFKEPLREKSISTSLDQMKEGLHFLLRHKMIWNTIVTFSVVYATYEILVNYFQPVMAAAKVPLIYFGIVYPLVNVFGFLGAHFYPQIKSGIGWKSIMLIYLFINLFCSMIFGTKIAVLVVIAIALLVFSSGSYDIYIGNIIHRVVPSSHRATSLSIYSQIFNLFFIIVVYVVGFSVDYGSIFVGMLVNAFIILAALLAFMRMSFGKEPARAEA
ncbi:MAG: MFS transporter [Patescibacteria group bacterium]